MNLRKLSRFVCAIFILQVQGSFKKKTLWNIFFETAVKMVSVISVQQSLLTCQTGHNLILCLQTNFPQMKKFAVFCSIFYFIEMINR